MRTSWLSLAIIASLYAAEADGQAPPAGAPPPPPTPARGGGNPDAPPPAPPAPPSPPAEAPAPPPPPAAAPAPAPEPYPAAPPYQTYPNNYPQTYPQTYPQNPETYPNPNYHTYVAPPPPPPEDGRECCLWSIRYDPFDLLFRRVTFVAEVAWWKLPFTTEITPKYIFNSPSNDLKEQGFDVGVNIAWYPGGKPLRGLWVKAHAEYENFRSTLTRKDANDNPLGKGNPDLCDADSAPGTCSRRVGSVILGLMVGSTYVFGKNGGFAISGGIGIGAAVAPKKTLEVLPCSTDDVAAKNPSCSAAETADSSSLSYSYYDEAARIRLLGTLGLGIAF